MSARTVLTLSVLVALIAPAAGQAPTPQPPARATALAWIGYQINDLLFPFQGILGAAGTVGAIRTAPSNFTGNPNDVGTGRGF